MVQGQLIFISGGARSGKSRYGEQLLTDLSSDTKRLVYIASGRATDQEMAERIAKHRQDRVGFNWQTIERPTDLSKALDWIEKGDLVLWDCMTTWLANEFYEGWETGTPCIQQENCMEEKELQLFATISQLKKRAAVFVIVSNEVFHELPSTYPETELYRKWLGRLHQKVVQHADLAIEMEFGLPTFWKGGNRR